MRITILTSGSASACSTASRSSLAKVRLTALRDRGAIEADPEDSVFLQFVYQRFLAHFCSSIEFTPVSGYDGLVFQFDDLLP